MPVIVYCEQRTPLFKVERKNRQFCSFLHHSCFQEITKDISCYTGIEERSSLQVFLHANNYSNLSKKTEYYVMRENHVDTPLQKKEFRRKEIEILMKDFFKKEQEIVSENNLKPEKHIHVDENNLLKRENFSKENDKESQPELKGLLDYMAELFDFVEIRPSEVVAYPATQQRILEPFLNKFTSPDSAPSKHDTMAVEFLRLCTMHDYPSTNGPSLLRLAQNGFYYDGNGTELICFSCGVKIRNWKYDDSPREIHLKTSPNCRFLLDSGDGNVPVPREDIHEGKPLYSVLTCCKV